MANTARLDMQIQEMKMELDCLIGRMMELSELVTATGNVLVKEGLENAGHAVAEASVKLGNVVTTMRARKA